MESYYGFNFEGNSPRFVHFFCNMWVDRLGERRALWNTSSHISQWAAMSHREGEERAEERPQ